MLALLLVLIVGTSYLLLRALNSALREARYQRQTAEVLARAKSALIGYAATYPDQVNGAFGPGYLPCPASDSSGMPRSACASSSNSMLGRLPWVYLGMADPRDASGAHLWYAVSDNFQYNPHHIPLNSSSPLGQLNVDTRHDIAAVIIAPGSAFDFQNRLLNDNNPADYLEQANATVTSGTGTFQASPGPLPGPFNDQVIAVTRGELMDAVRRRVLGEVAQDLEAYRTRFGAYPWLAAFKNPATATSFTSDTATLRREGQIPFHVPPDLSASLAPPLAVPQVFPTTFTFYWSVPSGGTVTIDPVSAVPLSWWVSVPSSLPPTVTANDVRNTAAGVSVTVDPPAQCQWQRYDQVTACSGQHTVTNGIPGLTPGTSTVAGYLVLAQQRSYQFTITYDGQSPPSPANYHCPASGPVSADCIVDPSASSVRTRTIYRSGAFPAGTSVSVKITDTVILGMSGFPMIKMTSVGTGSFDDTASGTLKTSGITYDLDPSPANPQTPWTPELPRWFIENKWEDLVYVAYAPGEALPGGSTPCTPGVNCLRVQDNRASPAATANNVRALVVAAGGALTGQNRGAGGGALGDYLEGQNASFGDGIFERRTASSTFNDLIRVISTAP